MKTEAFLELDGKINFVTKRGKKLTREEIDGKLVLELVLWAIEEGLKGQSYKK